MLNFPSSDIRREELIEQEFKTLAQRLAKTVIPYSWSYAAIVKSEAEPFINGYSKEEIFKLLDTLKEYAVPYKLRQEMKWELGSKLHSAPIINYNVA